MIRILLDKLDDRHDDFILKIDAMPPFAQKGDLFYLADFLELDPQQTDKLPDDLGIEYIKYVKNKVERLENAEVFVIFEITDEHIGGLLLKKDQRGQVRLSYVTTNEIRGYEINVEIIDSILSEVEPEFNEVRSWVFSEASIYEGLNWSMARIEKKGK